MTISTHVSLGVNGILAYILAHNMLADGAMDSKEMFLLINGAIVGSIVVDIDEPQSFIGRRARIISDLLKYIFGHRGFIHGVFFVFATIVLTVLAGGISDSLQLFMKGVVAGMVLHIAADMCNVYGVKVFSPLSERRYYLVPRGLRMRVLGIGEFLLMAVSMAANILVLQKFLNI